MKTKAMIKRIRKAAKDAGLECEQYELKDHGGIRVGSESTTFPRHSETSDLMAETIYKQLEPALGKGWWR